jgi:hypothetical protein
MYGAHCSAFGLDNHEFAYLFLIGITKISAAQALQVVCKRDDVSTTGRAKFDYAVDRTYNAVSTQSLRLFRLLHHFPPSTHL